jgi:hypothetical protein
LTKACNYGFILAYMEPQVVEVQEEQRMVGFPQQPKPEGSKNTKWIVAIVGVVIIVIIGLVFILMGPGGFTRQSSSTPTPVSNSLQTLPTNSPEPTPSAQATPTSAPVDREKISIEVLNGTGKVGDAGFLKGELEKLGYKDIAAGNAEDQNQEQTTAIFSTDLDQAYVDEIVNRLKDLYEDVRVRKQSLSDGDAKITTGTRKQTASASSTPSSTASSTPSPSPTTTPES